MSAKMETPADTNHCTEKSVLWLVSVFYLNGGMAWRRGKNPNKIAQERSERFWRQMMGTKIGKH